MKDGRQHELESIGATLESAGGNVIAPLLARLKDAPPGPDRERLKVDLFVALYGKRPRIAKTICDGKDT